MGTTLQETVERLRRRREELGKCYPVDAASVAAREAERLKHEANSEERRRLGLVAKLEGQLGARYQSGTASLDRFVVRHESQKKVVERLRELSKAIGPMTAAGSGIVWYGSVGTGKDHLAAALLYAAARDFGIECKWVSGMEVFGAFRDGMDGNRSEEDIIRPLTEPHVLCISDPLPPVGAPSAWNVQVLYRLLDRRYHALRPTWATLNVAGPDDADSRLTAPVFDRLRDNAELIPCFWPSFRRERRA